MWRHRLAPSPTGALHVGNLRSALAAWLAARAAGGAILLRMEDLDTARVRTGAATAILEDLRWLGLDWDEGPEVGGPVGPYVQSERRGLYERARAALAASGLAYPCACSRAEVAASAPHGGDAGARYGGRCRDEDPATVIERAGAAGRAVAWRFRVPEREIRFVDGVFGERSERLPETCGDFVIARSDGVVAYQLAVVVDDAAMGITDVVRGSDLLASTARQIALHEALREVGVTPPSTLTPRFLHVPLVLGREGEKLSKRERPASVGEMRGRGVRPERLAGVLARTLGLDVGDVPPERMTSAWDPARIGREDGEVVVES